MTRLTRRALLAQAGGGALLWSAGCAGPLAHVAPLGSAPPPRETLAAAQDRLLPSSPGAPGAADVDAIGFLERARASGALGASDHAALLAGAARLDDGARAAGFASFVQAPPLERDRLLRSEGQRPEGRAFIERLLTLTLEAFFSDPRYGGNPGGLCWAWAGVTPPTPRPAP